MLGLFMIFIGTIWIGQGINADWAPQSFMTSDVNWSYRGGGLAGVGALCVLAAIMNGGWRHVLGSAGVVIAFVGAVLAAQAFNILPGMPMSGNMDWALRGGIAFGVGVALVCVSTLGANQPPKSDRVADVTSS